LICWEHSELAQGVDAEQFSSADFAIAVFGEERRVSVTEHHLQEIKLIRNITVEVPSFSLLPAAIIGSNRLAIVHRRQAELFQKMFPIVIRPLPIKGVIVKQIAQWHQLREQDNGLKWLLKQLTEEARRIL